MANRSKRRQNMKAYNVGVNTQAPEAPTWMTPMRKRPMYVAEETVFRISRNFTKGKARRIAVSVYGSAMKACEGMEYAMISSLSSCGTRFYVKFFEKQDGDFRRYRLMRQSNTRVYTAITLSDEDIALLGEWEGEYKTLHYERTFDAYYVNKSERIKGDD